MTRLNNKKELWHHLSSVNVVRDTTGGGSTTLAAATTAGGTTLSATASTNFAPGDLVRIDSGGNEEWNEINGAITGAGPFSFPLKYPIYAVHPTGADVVEISKTNLGHVVDGGVTVQFDGDDNAVNSATRRLVLGYLTGHVGITATFGVTGYNVESFMTAMGSLDTSANVTGTGVSATPFRGVIDTTKAKEIFNIGFSYDGVRKDGGIVEMQLWGVEFNPTAVQNQVARGPVSGISMACRVTAGLAVIQYN